MLWNTWRIAGLRTSRTLIGSPSSDTTGRLTRVSLLGASMFQQETTTINPWFISRKRGLGVRQHGGHRCRIWHGILGQPAPLGGNSPHGSLLPVRMQEHSLYILHKSPTKKKKKPTLHTCTMPCMNIENINWQTVAKASPFHIYSASKSQKRSQARLLGKYLFYFGAF